MEKKTVEGTLFGFNEGGDGILEFVFQNTKDEISYYEATKEQIDSWAMKIP